MSKAVLLSIQPKWCELIASGRKTVEVRKTRPKIQTPFKCYIYCTKDRKEIFWDSHALMEPYKYIDDHSHNMWDKPLNGKVIGEFVCEHINEIVHYGNLGAKNICIYEPDGTVNNLSTHLIEERSCLTRNDIEKYSEGKNVFAWHISDLVIYDVPKELEEFKCADHVAIKKCGARERMYNNPDFTYGVYLPGGYYCNKDSDFCSNCKTKKLTHAPQSWCYVECLEDMQ